MSKTHRHIPASLPSFGRVRYAKRNGGVLTIPDGQHECIIHAVAWLDDRYGNSAFLKRQASRARRHGWQIDLD